jgi:transcriptional regulator with XRE-family HTH domain
MALGERIRHLRKEAGWSQAELGERVGTDAGRISRYEGARITPSLDALMRIAEVFNVSADHLLFDDVPCRLLHATEDAWATAWPSSASCRPTTSPDCSTWSTAWWQEPAAGHGRRPGLTSAWSRPGGLSRRER